MLLSVVLPVFNEEKSIPLLFQKLQDSLREYTYEIIAVDDGSSDNTWSVLKDLAKENKQIKVLHFRRNFGQTAAINAGVRYSKGDVIVLIDSDLENDPADIPVLLKKMDEGYDVISGWRQDRWKGEFFTRKLPSMMANKLISKISGVYLNDYGCTLKAYRRDVLIGVKLYGQMHRFIPVFCKWQGGRVAEVPVSYRPRQFGKSNYGLFRIFRVFLDLILIKFLDRYMNRPGHFFGGVGLLFILAAAASFFLALFFKLNGQKDFVETPLPVFTAMFFTVGVLMILLGVIAEILIRTYYEGQSNYPYTINDKANVDD